MSVIAQAIADRQSEIDRFQAEIKALTDVGHGRLRRDVEVSLAGQAIGVAPAPGEEAPSDDAARAQMAEENGARVRLEAMADWRRGGLGRGPVACASRRGMRRWRRVRPGLAESMLLSLAVFAFAALAPAPVQAQETDIWTATLTVGNVRDGLRGFEGSVGSLTDETFTRSGSRFLIVPVASSSVSRPRDAFDSVSVNVSSPSSCESSSTATSIVCDDSPAWKESVPLAAV